VERDLAFGLENLALPREELRRRVEWAIETINLSDIRDRPPHELSGGQQQKVAIACVLAMIPKVIVLDEPTSFLDPLSAKSILEVVWKLNRELNITVFMVEHRLELVARYASRILVMYGGKIKFDGQPRAILGRDEDELKIIGIPKAAKLHKMLVNGNILKPPVSLSADELSAQLREIFNS
jgi:energy-coupling factor transporter ATP-binding protein EcfA2